MNIALRIIVDIVLFISIFTAPWWLTIALAIVSLFIIHGFYEVLIIAVLLDGFHGVPGVSFFGYNLFFTTVISVAFVLTTLIKPRLNFYDRL